MRVVVVIYPVPAQSVFCVVCFFPFFSSSSIYTKILRGIQYFGHPLLHFIIKIPKSFDETFGAFSFGENTHETGEEDILPKKRRETS